MDILAYENTFEITNGKVNFTKFEEIKKNANIIAIGLKNIEVTKDTVKSNKKLVAKTRKATDKLKSDLVNVKKQLLIPYENVKIKVDEIVKIVDDAEQLVRKQTKDFEEKEREQKKNDIEKIFNLHLKRYPEVAKHFTFDDFLQPEYLNKSKSLTACEVKLVSFLEQVNLDLNIILENENKVDILYHYKQNKNLAQSLDIVNKSLEKKETIKKIIQTENTKENFTITVFNKKDYELLKMYAKEMNIKVKGE